MLTETARLLSNLTDYAAVVVAPGAEGGVIRSLQLVALGLGADACPTTGSWRREFDQRLS